MNCFNADIYASKVACDRYPSQCITPTNKGTRCTAKLTREDLADASRLMEEAEALPDSPERNEKLACFLLLRTCSKYFHRGKLQSNKYNCLDLLVQRYHSQVTMATQASHEHTTSPRSSSTDVTISFDARSSHERRERSTTPLDTASGMTLRSGTLYTSTVETTARFRRAADGFSPFITERWDTVRRNLLQNVPKAKLKSGKIYSFTWPSHPDYVKVGYSASSATYRLAQWQLCHPGAILSKSASVRNVERIETLIHRQMAQQRRMIASCDQCNKTHIEWFQASIEDVNQVMSDWAELMNREPLYDENGVLTQKWFDRVRRFDGDITARSLLNSLDTELETARMKSSRALKKELSSWSKTAIIPGSTTTAVASTVIVVAPPTSIAEQEPSQQRPTSRRSPVGSSTIDTPSPVTTEPSLIIIDIIKTLAALEQEVVEHFAKHGLMLTSPQPVASIA